MSKKTLRAYRNFHKTKNYFRSCHLEGFQNFFVTCTLVVLNIYPVDYHRYTNFIWMDNVLCHILKQTTGSHTNL